MEMQYEDDYDAYDAMMNRGAFLRKLRQMAEEDEAQRDESPNDVTDSDTLDYQSYLSVQAVYDDYKHVNYRFIDFGSVAGPTRKTDNENQDDKENQITSHRIRI